MLWPLNSRTVTLFSVQAVMMPVIWVDSSLAGTAARTCPLTSKSRVSFLPSSAVSKVGAAVSETANSVESTLTLSGKRKEGEASSYRPVMRALETSAVWVEGLRVTTSYFLRSDTLIVEPLRSMR